MTYTEQYTTRKPLHPSSDYNLCKFAFARVTLVILIHSGGCRGGARGTRPLPLFVDQTEDENNFFGDHPPPPHPPLISRSGSRTDI